MNSLSGNDHAAVSKFRTEGVHEWQGREGETEAGNWLDERADRIEAGEA